MKEYFTTHILKGIILVGGLLWSSEMWAQVSPKPSEKSGEPRGTMTVLDEHKDAKGNTVRVIEYRQGGSRITETITIPLPETVNVRVAIRPDTVNKDSVLIIVNKSKYRLELYYRRRLVRSYKAVFGPKPMENKRYSGDRCTPEGWFLVQNKNPNSKYHKFMLLDYPNDSSVARFNLLKERGAIPATAKIGGDIGIHGIWKGGDDMIEKGVCWTDGCIALRNKDVDELYDFVGVGTRVLIRK
jgi:lipoprotein-anchoring transpeptidase ErfK/SrfK